MFLATTTARGRGILLRMSTLLTTDTKFLRVEPSVAKLIGLNEALMLQQVSWLYSHEHDRWYINDYGWVLLPMRKLRKHFPFWSERTIRRIIEKLESDGYLVSVRCDLPESGNPKYYRIDYDELEALFDRNGLELNPEVLD